MDYGKDMGTSFMEEKDLTEPLSFLSITKYQCSICTAFSAQCCNNYNRSEIKTALGIINESDIFIPPNELNTRQYNVYEI